VNLAPSQSTVKYDAWYLLKLLGTIGGPLVKLDDESGSVQAPSFGRRRRKQTREQREKLWQVYDRASTSLGLKSDHFTDSLLESRDEAATRQKHDSEKSHAKPPPPSFHIYPLETVGYIPPACRRQGRRVYENKFYQDRLMAKQKHNRYLEEKDEDARKLEGLKQRLSRVPIRPTDNMGRMDTLLMRENFI